MSDAALLLHDVGKYVSRVACNVPAGAVVPAPLKPMLARDLYALPSGKRASERFDELARSMEPDPRLEEARALLCAIDALEDGVRAGDDASCTRACEAATRISALLREVAGR